MIIYDWLFFIIRILTITPLVYLLIKQGFNIIKRRGFNGLSKTRKTLLLCTIAVLARQSVYFVGDLHCLFLNKNKHIWFGQVQLVLLAVNITILYAILRFYQLFSKSKGK